MSALAQTSAPTKPAASLPTGSIPSAGLSGEALQQAIRAACGRIAPLWPLQTYVAVNPFLGFTGQSFAATCATLKRVTGTDMLMPRSWYREGLRSGLVTDDDLAAALARTPRAAGGPSTPAELRAAAQREPLRLVKPRAVVATVSEVLDRLSDGDRQASRTAFMIDEISKWCAAYFDAGQAAWSLPGRTLAPYPAWRLYARHDRNPEVFGIRSFRASVGALPEDPVAAIEAVVAGLGIPPRAVEDYLFRALFDILGWSAYVRQLGWLATLDGADDDRLVHLLAIRLVWGYGLFLDRQDDAFRSAWAEAMAEAAALPADDRLGLDPELAIDLALQSATEIAHQRRLMTKLAAKTAAPAPIGRPAVQAAFCIDVRSEIIRRALETTAGDVETVGFAGFFGFPIEYVPIGQTRGGAQCPVLLKPSVVVCEAVGGADTAAEAAIMRRRMVRRRVAKVWKAFKTSAVSCFTYVEAAGLGYAAKIASDAAGLTRPVPHPHLDGLDASALKTVGPRLDPRIVGGRATGFEAARRVDMAEAVLKGMSLTEGFARLVLLVGHGSSTVNNPHAAGLDCGACGGHTGEANARVAAGILNDPAVRAGLAARGIPIPADTWFVAGLHDTTTDEIRLFEVERVPAGLSADLRQLRGSLDRAADLARAERATLLGLGDMPSPTPAVLARSRDWSQVRPEWGLAGNAAFIAAPRHRTAGLDLGGRTFLHSYDWRKDDGFAVLDLIMTAPMVVASWINLAYYGSVVNNRVFGAGNKTLHNVVGTIGVLEGNGGDLRIGLPWQSVHDGERLVHEPLRLSVVIEAPLPAINDVLAKRQGVRDLVENGWIHLFAITDDGVVVRHVGDGTWISEARG